MNYSTILKCLREYFGAECTDDGMMPLIEKWREWYSGTSEGFHKIFINNGLSTVSREMFRLNMAKRVCEDWANLLLNEKTLISISGGSSEEFVCGKNGKGGVLGENSFHTAMNRLVEKSFALGTGAVIENTATADGTGFAPVTATETILHSAGPDLRIAKSIDPQTVKTGGNIVYTFVISNYGDEATDADGVKITDEFDPILTTLEATLDGAQLVETTDYTYDGVTGLFETVEGVITVPAATYFQNDDGSWTTVPGETVLTVTGTIN